LEIIEGKEEVFPMLDRHKLSGSAFTTRGSGHISPVTILCFYLALLHLVETPWSPV
jgi:hypothetical protein